MTQRTVAALVAVPLVIALLVAAWTQPLPYVTYEPGLTVDVLAETEGREIIEIDGQKTYRNDGELRMTTVFVSRPRAEIGLLELMTDWVSSEAAVYPYDAVYQPDETAEENETEGAVAMVSSQDSAVAVALEELGFDFEQAVAVLYVTPDAPADGELQVRDVFVRADGKAIESSEDLVQAIQGSPDGQPVVLEVLRDGEPREVTVTPEVVEGRKQIGIRLGGGFKFPFDVQVNIDSNIGGPSAGLMFALGIYDTLTPGSLTDGRIVAGTGTIEPNGEVGPIGGIQQKIAGAEAAGAELFLVPPDNCADALGAENGDMRLVRAATMHTARKAIEAWVADDRTTLPSCKDDA